MWTIFCTGEEKTVLFSTKIGTPAYRAPELDTGTYTNSADLYSLGLILWEILCQIPPKQKNVFFRRLKGKDYTVLDTDKTDSILSNGAGIIVSLIKEKSGDRPQSTREIRIVTAPRIRFTPGDTFQLKTFLDCGGHGGRIELGRVLCHKTSLSYRQDTMILEWNLTLTKNLTNLVTAWNPAVSSRVLKPTICTDLTSTSLE